MFNLFDSFSAGISLLFLVTFELLVFGWIYGKNISNVRLLKLTQFRFISWAPPMRSTAHQSEWLLCRIVCDKFYPKPNLVLGFRFLFFFFTSYDQIPYNNSNPSESQC